MSVTGVDSLVDEYGNTIELDNPTRLKDSSDRSVVIIKNKLPDDGNKFILKEDKSKKKRLPDLFAALFIQ
jgi:hypothetical protein